MALPLYLGADAAEGYAPRTWAEIDLAAIRHNIRSLRRHLAPAQLLAVVKANAYGLGAVPVATAALEAGATGLVVASCEEGHELRRAGLSGPILVLGYVPVELAALAVEAELTLTVNSPELAQALSRVAGRVRRKANPLPVHLKLETGLNRFGLDPDRALTLARLISNLPGLVLEGIYTHFATGDEPDQSFVHEQQRRFTEICKHLAAHGFHFPQQHLSNSASGVSVKAAGGGLARIGLGLYGYHPSPEVEAQARRVALFLRPVLTLKSVVAHLNDLEAGETVGYNRTYTAHEARRIALVPIGYADGYPRALSNKGAALVNGQRAPIVGRISMDQFTLDVSDIEGVQEGDEVVLIGSQGQNDISLEEVAAHCDTISYEILTGLGRRVRRVYLG